MLFDLLDVRDDTLGSELLDLSLAVGLPAARVNDVFMSKAENLPILDVVCLVHPQRTTGVDESASVVLNPALHDQVLVDLRRASLHGGNEPSANPCESFSAVACIKRRHRYLQTAWAPHMRLAASDLPS